MNADLRFRTFLAFATFAAAATCLRAAQPLSLHPENPHYFLFRGKPTVIITSAEHYGAVLNLDFNYVRYLDELAAHGLNNTRTFTGAYVEPPGAFNIARNTLAPAIGKFISPWARSETPGYPNGGNKFDLMKWDENYFRRLKDFVAQAGKRGVIVEMNLFCPFYDEAQWKLSPQNAANNVNGIGNVGRTNVYTLDKHGGLLAVHDAMVRKFVTELNEFDNLYYEICNEPYFGGVTLDWQHHIAEVIATTEKAMPNKHLISRNVANGSAKVENPHPAISILNFHYASPPDAVAANYHLNKPIGDNETGFRGTNDLPYRQEAWEFILAGGALYNNLDYSFVAGHEEGTFAYPAGQPGGGNRPFRVQMRVLRDFINAFDFIRMKPDNSVIKGGVPGGYTSRAFVQSGKAYGVYLAPMPVTKDEFSVRWIGRIEPRASGEHTFYTVSNDGVRLWIDGKSVIDNWTDHAATENSGRIQLEAGRKHDIKIEFYQGGGNAVMRLLWSTGSEKKEVVPTTRLSTPDGRTRGLAAEYFDGKSFNRSKMKRTDAVVDFDWSAVSPFGGLKGDVNAERSTELALELPGGRYLGEWINTRSGAVEKREEFQHGGGVRSLRSPVFRQDIALRVVAR